MFIVMMRARLCLLKLGRRGATKLSSSIDSEGQFLRTPDSFFNMEIGSHFVEE